MVGALRPRPRPMSGVTRKPAAMPVAKRPTVTPPKGVQGMAKSAVARRTAQRKFGR